MKTTRFACEGWRGEEYKFAWEEVEASFDSQEKWFGNGETEKRVSGAGKPQLELLARRMGLNFSVKLLTHSSAAQTSTVLQPLYLEF